MKTFLCKGCLEEIPVEQSSPDPRYCVDCYRFLVKEAAKTKKAGKWVPVVGGTVPDLSVQPGDRIKTSDRIDSDFSVVKSVDGDSIVTNHGKYTIYDVIEIQQKGGAFVAAQDNLAKCRATLAKVIGRNDQRVIDLWKSKVAQAEQLCIDTGTNKATGSSNGHACCCGCGAITNKGKYFMQGHDARLRSMLAKLDSGRISLHDLPNSVQKMIADDHPIIKQMRHH